ncbi:MAG TPA: hypothetical protein VGV40_02270 [Solirubrobacteraceae bacterium]|nr:hypothetical protein [Solirubrobacteraceae bacterium]
MERRAPTRPRGAGDNLHVCRSCGLGFVMPTQILDILDDGRRLVELTCANCRLRVMGAHDHAALEALEDELEHGYAQICAACERLARENERAAVETFAAALHAGAILPEDF